MIPRRTRLAGRAVLVVLAATTLGGCTLFNWFAAQFAPPKKVKAIYEPPAEEKVYLVFVDDLLHPVTYEPFKRMLTEKLGEALVEQDIAMQVVDYERLLDLMAAESDFNSMPISVVGERLGADVVLYVQVTDFQLKDNDVSPLWRGRFDASLRVVDVVDGRLWPRDRPQGYPMERVETPQTEHPSPTYGAELARKMAELAADRIAKLFYDHKVPARPFAGKERDIFSE